MKIKKKIIQKLDETRMELIKDYEMILNEDRMFLKEKISSLGLLIPNDAEDDMIFENIKNSVSQDELIPLNDSSYYVEDKSKVFS
jgi:hypothetical protein